MSHWLMLPLLLPLAAGMVNLLLSERNIEVRRWVSLLSTAGALAVTIGLMAQTMDGTVSVYRLGNWPAPFGIVLVLDRLSALLLVTANLLALFSLLHATQGEDGWGHNFHVLFPIQLLGINGAFLTGDLFNLFVFFEVLLIASYCLALHGGGPERVRASLQYVVLNLIGSAFFLIALGTLYGSLGTLNMADLALKVAAAHQEQVALLRVSGLMLLVVFGLKAAILPLHPWLPPLYGSILAPVAALFAVMTKVGVYAIIRTMTLIFPPAGTVGVVIGAVLPVLALCTLAAGGLGVLAADRLRSLIAYLVVLSVGTLIAGIGQMTDQGLAAALYYLPHTTLVSGGLFLLAEPIIRQRGRLSDTLAGEASAVASTRLAALFFFGAVAAAGLPPLSGFIGKLLLLRSVAPGQGAWLWGAILGSSLFSLIALVRAGNALFWGEPSPAAEQEKSSWLRLLPASLLLAASLMLTVAASPVNRYVEATARQLRGPQSYIGAVLGSDSNGGTP